jgi:hypothetical protein
VFSRTRPSRRFAMNSYTASTATASLFSAGTPANAASKQPAMPASTFATQSSDQTFAMILGRILAGMTGNPAYADPQPTLAELAAARDDFVAAVNANDRWRSPSATRPASVPRRSPASWRCTLRSSARATSSPCSVRATLPGVRAVPG